MTKKRFGVQLAAAGLVILIGALGVARAQRDTQKNETVPAAGDLAAPSGPPQPIAAIDDSGSPDPLNTGSDQGPAFQNAAFASGHAAWGGDSQGLTSWDDAAAVRQAGHEETNHEQADPPAPQSFDFNPGAAAAVEDADTAAEQFGQMGGFAVPPQGEPDSHYEPGDFAGDAAAGPGFGLPAAGLTMPGRTAPDAAASEPIPAAADASTGDFGGGEPVYGGFAMPDASVASDVSAIPDASETAESPALQPLDASAATIDVSAIAADRETADAAEAGQGSFAAGPVNGLRSVPADVEAAAQSAGIPADENAPPAQSPAQFGAPPTDTSSSFTMDAVTSAPVAAASSEGFDSQDWNSPSMTDSEPPAPGSAAPPRVDSAMAAAAGVGADDARIAEVVLNEPGDRRLEGSQTPSVLIQKRAPDQVKVGKPAAFVIHVQNVGGVEALGVQVHDRVPAGMRLVDASPQPQQHGDLLLWQLGALEPGGERTISMQLIPEEEGELGSVARVTFEAAASVRTVSTRPALKITQRAPTQVLIGQQLEIELEVSNPGTGVATGVIVQADVPEGFEHPKGRQLDNLIGTLAPGEVRRQILRMRAVAPGTIDNEIRLVADDDLAASDRTTIEVIAPQLAIELEGPARRFLERQATYQVNLANVGSAEATNVEVVAYLDRGFSFVGTEYQGQYDPTRHAVYWSLAELPPEARGAVPLTLLPIEQGERAIRLEARGDLNALARYEKKVNVDAVAELTFSISDDADPIEVGSTATYEIRIANRGSREDADVSLKLQLPPGLELVSSEGDASTDGNGLVVFSPQTTMAPRSEIVHRVRVRGSQAGTHVVKAVLSSRESPVAVTKEESTTVYEDR